MQLLFFKQGLKQAEYRTIVSIVIANLAAIEGGVDSAQAYELSDVFFQRLEKCNSIAKFDEVTRDATLAYVKLVKNNKNSATNYHVSRCKDYISAHIQENIKVSTLAECAGLDESYLGRLFKESEGISIKKYIHQKKWRLRRRCWCIPMPLSRKSRISLASTQKAILVRYSYEPIR